MSSQRFSFKLCFLNCADFCQLKAQICYLQGDTNGKAGACLLCGFKGNRPSHFFNNSIGNGKAKPGAALLSGIKRLKNFVLIIFINPAPGILHRNLNLPGEALNPFLIEVAATSRGTPCFPILAAYGYGAAGMIDRLCCIQEQIPEDLLELLGICLKADIISNRTVYFQSFAAFRAVVKKLEHFLNHVF